MNREKRRKVMEACFQKVRELEATKGKEYASDADALDNFKQCGGGLTPFQVLWVHLYKQFRAIDTAIARSPVYPDFLTEPAIARIGDAMNYLTLLAGLLEDCKPESWLSARDKEAEDRWNAKTKKLKQKKEEKNKSVSAS